MPRRGRGSRRGEPFGAVCVFLAGQSGMMRSAGEGGSGRNSRVNMKHMKKHTNNMTKKGKFKPGSKKRENKCIVMFDDSDRQEYLTGFHKRKVERRKAAVVEIQNKIKEEQKKVREQRHKEYMKMLKERRDALDEIESEDELEDVITDTTESVQYDHPNHTVTVTTISDLDLTGESLLGLGRNEVNGEGEDEHEERGEEEEERRVAMPKKAGDPILNKKICSLTASLHAHTKRRKKKGKGPDGRRGRGRMSDKKSGVTERKKRSGRTTKKQRRLQTGKRVHCQD